MSHPDEGALQMLLDGELDVAERARVEAHIRACASCTARLEEANAFLQEANRLVEVLAVPQRGTRPLGGSLRRPLIRTLAWAASIVIAVGVGYWGRGVNPATLTPVVLQEGDRPAKANVHEPDLALEPRMDPAPADATIPAAISPPAETRARTDADARQPSGEAKAADKPSANELARDRLAAAPASTPALRGARLTDESSAAWRVISMEEAVRLMDGQIRLIDGLTPDRVETGPGTAVAGADPALPLVRVVYASGTITLDEQRPPAVAAERQEAAAKAVGGMTAQSAVTSWQVRDGIRFVVTGSVSADSIRALGAQVR